MKTSLVITILNEEKTIASLLHSIFSQTVKPNEVIIIDGGSRDRTVANIKSQISNLPTSLRAGKYPNKFKIYIKKGNRSVGRNYGIKQARGDTILCSDAGCILDKKWIKNITEPFKNKRIDVVAGYYSAKPKTVFQKCLVPYVLVMPDKVNPRTFLPATRSMAFTKKIWKKMGGFNERFSHNEDHVFAKRLKKMKANIFFEKKAIVYWQSRKNIKEAFIMFYRFAIGDAEANIARPKVVFLFCRYIAVVLLAVYVINSNSYRAFYGLCLLIVLYVIWAIVKNYKYVKNWKAILYLPFLQFTSDIAVLLGTLTGILKSTFFLKKNDISETDLFTSQYLGIIVLYLIIDKYLIIPLFQNASHILFLSLFFIPLIFFILRYSSFKVLLQLLIGTLLLLAGIFLSFRQIRSIFPSPKITGDSIVGYVHYFGYPFYFDTLLLLVFLSLPVFLFLFIFQKRQKKA